MTASEVFAAIAAIAADAALDWNAEGVEVGERFALRIEAAAEAQDLAAVKTLSDDAALALGGPVMHVEGQALVQKLLAADAALAVAVEDFDGIDEEAGDDEIAEVRQAVLTAAASATSVARKRAHDALGWDGLRG